MPRMDLKNCTLQFQDATPTTPLVATIIVGDGTITWDEKKNREYMKDRGRLRDVRDGDEEPMDVKIDFAFEYLKADTGQAASPEDVVKKRGVAAAWVSVDTDLCQPYAVNILITHTPICTADKKEVIVLPAFRYEDISHDPKTGMCSMSGKCNSVEATITRVAQA